MGFPKISNTATGYTAVSVAPLKRVALDIPGTVDASGLSRAQIYKDLRAGKLVAYKNGSRTLIFLDDLEGYLRGLPRAQFRPLADEAAINIPNSDARSETGATDVVESASTSGKTRRHQTQK
ncbi:helix-turn-helix domain-containing protein [Phyllobacterium sp. P5_D12]